MALHKVRCKRCTCGVQTGVQRGFNVGNCGCQCSIKRFDLLLESCEVVLERNCQILQGTRALMVVALCARHMCELCCVSLGHLGELQLGALAGDNGLHCFVLIQHWCARRGCVMLHRSSEIKQRCVYQSPQRA